MESAASESDTGVEAALFQLFARGRHGQFAVLHTFGADQAVGDFFYFMTLAPYDQHFKTVVGVEMDVECRYNLVIGLVLQVR